MWRKEVGQRRKEIVGSEGKCEGMREICYWENGEREYIIKKRKVREI